MAEFLFSEWPHGPGPFVVQLALMVAGVAGGIRAVDDLRSWLTRGNASGAGTGDDAASR